MDDNREHRITIKIAGVEPFRLPVSESEESFYRLVIKRINENVDRLSYGAAADPQPVALAKVALYYATMLYRQTNMINSQARMLADFEERLDALLEGTD
ncbi:MAG: hypothetical protein K2L92_09250 [Muribaculaceae bacterium]|nr:hypothetical protein [Muribaculaceae bacterium]MDE6564997.1 hypothetical protein [Muribaculaceae bacterium]